MNHLEVETFYPSSEETSKNDFFWANFEVDFQAAQTMKEVIPNPRIPASSPFPFFSQMHVRFLGQKSPVFRDGKLDRKQGSFPEVLFCLCLSFRGLFRSLKRA